MPNIFLLPQTRKYAIEQSDLSSLNSLNKNEHYKSASKTNNNMVTKTRPWSTAENSANGKVPSKNQQFWRSWKSLSQVFPDFPLEETRHASPNLDRERPAKYRYSSNMAEHDSSHISSLTILDHAKMSNPHPQPPLFSKQFSKIYLFPDLTILVLTILFRRRFRL